MGYLLRRAMAESLPAGLSSGERLVALEVADQANDDTGVAYGAELLETVARRCGLASPKQVGQILTKLGARGLEFREVLGTDSRGRQVFAHRGRQSTYRVPAPLMLPRARHHPETDGAVLAAALPENAAAGADESCRADGQKLPSARHPSPQALLSSQLASFPAKTKPKDKADRLIDQHAPDLDRATVARHLAERGRGLGVLAAAERDGTLLDLFAAVRAWAAPTVQPPQYADWVQPAGGCGGCDRGWVELPDGRLARCPACQPQPVNGHRR